MTKSAGAELRAMMARPGIVIAPGASDALTARLVEEAGFSAVFCTGGGIARSHGLPDLGYLTASELVARIANMTETCALPMIVDADSGFGTALNLRRTVRALERAGAAAMHIEDMEVPRRHRDAAANYLEPEAMARRIRAACAARLDPQFVVIARTDVTLDLGVDAAIDRANRYADAGADLVYVEFSKTRAIIEAVARRVTAPKLISLNKGENELLTAGELAEMGYKVLTHPADTQLAAIHAMRAVLHHLKRHGSSGGFEAMISFAERDRIVDTAAHRAIEDGALP
jgi:2-methylisocitrate lyase-like PEP mutase family enzyme